MSAFSETQTKTSHSVADVLRRLITFDTSNPPGNERECIGYIRDLLEASGISTQTFARDEQRPNLLARLPGSGSAPPLMLYGHVDVVPTTNQNWTHPPFGGEIHDGYIWGRGALDMKSGVAMMLSVLLRAKAENLTPAGDVLLLVLSDEEAGGEFGARYMVEQHADLFKDVRYAIGEFGGFTQQIVGKRFYPIQVAEKLPCRIKVTVRGRGGHGALHVPGNTMAVLGEFLTRINTRALPIHITGAVTKFIEAVAARLDFPLNVALRGLLVPGLADAQLKLLTKIQPQAGDLVPLLRNTVNATMVQGGDRINVIPEAVSVGLDGRVLPGYTADDLIRELREVIGMLEHVEYEVMFWENVKITEPDMGLYDMLADILGKADPDGTPIPYLLHASTDGRHFAKLGIQTYGYTPMKLPTDFNFTRTIHAGDERIPVEALTFGADCMVEVLRRFGR
jgi:acetylornithine deacetylase/succinyl-diaminopimelate desuccinylase-like protein